MQRDRPAEPKIWMAGCHLVGLLVVGAALALLFWGVRQPLHRTRQFNLQRVAQLEQLLANAIDLRRGVDVSAATHHELELSIRATGSFAGLCQLLWEVERLPRIASVRRLDVHATAEADAHQFDLTYVLYYGLQSTMAAPATTL